MRPSLPLVLGGCVLAAALGPAAHAAPPLPGGWVMEHLALDAGVLAGWRAAWAASRHEGFEVIGGGGEVNLGLEFDSGWVVLVGGHVLAGENNASQQITGSTAYFEGSGQVSGQLRFTDWARIQLGASVGQMRYSIADPQPATATVTLAGGFLRFGVDWLPRNAALFRALNLFVRLDIDGHPGGGPMAPVPDVSLAMSLGTGFRL